MSVSFAQEEAGSWEATEGGSRINDNAELKIKTAEEIAEEEAERKATIQEEIYSAVLAQMESTLSFLQWKIQNTGQSGINGTNGRVSRRGPERMKISMPRG